jgi:hypothetical protein
VTCERLSPTRWPTYRKRSWSKNTISSGIASELMAMPGVPVHRESPGSIPRGLTT